MKLPALSSLCLAVAAVAIASCEMRPGGADVCSNANGVEGSFVFATAPRAGERVQTGFAVAGCSRTFESQVNWTLKGREGAALASGHTTGGGVDGPANFSFVVSFNVSQREVGHLEVYEEDASDGEGFPPGRTVVPLVLEP